VAFMLEIVAHKSRGAVGDDRNTVLSAEGLTDGSETETATDGRHQLRKLRLPLD
jgi:hypothetical protein